MKKMDLTSRFVLVTGASSGLGKEIARILAKKYHSNLILVARREDRLEQLKKELLETEGIDIHNIVADLSRKEDVQRVFSEATGDGREVYGVILNAGVTSFGPFLEQSWDEFDKLLQTNVVGTVRLTSLFLNYLREKRQGGGIMLITSLTGFVPAPYQAIYSACKAFLVALGRCLYHELLEEDISITTVLPGGMMTEMTERTGMNKYFDKNHIQFQDVKACAEESINAFRNRRYILIPGMFNRIQIFFSPFVPKRFLGNRMADVYRKALKAARSQE